VLIHDFHDLSGHVTHMELYLSCLPDDAAHVNGFGREDTGVLELVEQNVPS
jgi:hypothetical protein